MDAFNFETNTKNIDLERNSLSSNSETNPISPDFETSPPKNEYFPQKKQNSSGKTRREKNKKSAFTKMLAASTTLAVTVTAIAGSSSVPPTQLPLPTPALPPPPTAQVVEYRPEHYIYGDDPTDSADDTFVAASYDVAFTFYLDEGEVESVTITGSSYEGSQFFDEPQPSPVEQIVEKEELTLGENGQITAIYSVEDASYRHELTPTLNYSKLNADTGQLERKTIEGELFVADFNYLYFSEMDTTNTVSEIIDGNTIKCTFNFNEFSRGCFDFKVEYLSIDYGDQVLTFDSENSPEKLPKLEDGKLSYYFEFEKPIDTDSVLISVEIAGSNYFNGQQIGNSTGTNAMKEIIWGTAYSAAKLEYDETDPAMTVNGLTISSAKYFSYGGNVESADKILPGSLVTVYLVLEGLAAESGTITANITVNEQLIYDLDLTYAATTVYQNDDIVFLDFSFTMPAQNLTAEDIIINGFTFTPNT